MSRIWVFATFTVVVVIVVVYVTSSCEDSGGPGLLDRIFPSLSGFLRFRLPSGLAANESTCYPGFYRQAMNGAAVRCRT
jgi:hypothetical protein